MTIDYAKILLLCAAADKGEPVHMSEFLQTRCPETKQPAFNRLSSLCNLLNKLAAQALAPRSNHVS